MKIVRIILRKRNLLSLMQRGFFITIPVLLLLYRKSHVEVSHIRDPTSKLSMGLCVSKPNFLFLSIYLLTYFYEKY